MGAKHEPNDLYLSYLDVLEEEDEALHGSPDEGILALRQAYAEARGNRGRLSKERATGEAIRVADLAVVAAEETFRKALFNTLHKRKRSAMCLSGGGIRSATFGLGLLQGFAASSRKAEDRPMLLGEFDYLSTVSGGGYVGSWFSGWAARLANPSVRRLSECGALDTLDGSAKAIEALAKSPDSDFEPEPGEVHHLRSYSNYLAPRLGLFSADTWSLASILVRNMFLNWLVLIPLFAAALLIPVLAWQLLRLDPGEVQSVTLWFLLLAAAALGAFSVAYVGYDLPNAGSARRSTNAFLVLCLLPLCLSAIHLNVFWGWLPVGGHGGAWWDIITLGKGGVRWWHYAVFGMLMHGGGMLAGILFSSLAFGRPPKKTGLAATAAATLTGFIGGLAAFGASHLAQFGVTGKIVHPLAYAVLGFPVVIGIFLFSQMLLVGAGSYITEDEDREWWARAGGWLIGIGIGWCVFGFLVLFSESVFNWANLRLSTAFTAATGLSGWAAARAGKSPVTGNGGRRSDSEGGAKLFSNKYVKEYCGRLLLPVFVVLLAMLLGAADIELVKVVDGMPQLLPSFWPGFLAPMGNITAHTLWVMLAEVAVCLMASYFININKFSLHGMYRLRLIRAYLGASNPDRKPNMFTGFDENDNLSLCSLTKHKPLHVVNMALNLVHGSNLAWQQRKAESFTATRLHVGSCRVGYRSSSTYGGRYKLGKNKAPISLGTAMTISGAAASPNMGYHSSPLLSLVMMLFNARLGWWLGNPRSVASVWQRPGPRWGIRPFIDEAFGRTTDSNDWLYLSDGGHFENLGVYEMVLRRCHLILVSDAGADPKYTYEDLANAVQKVRVDLGIPIEFDPPKMPMSPSHQRTDEFSGRHCAVGRIRYGVIDAGADDGVLIYIKPSLNGNETADIQHYATMNPSFPQQPTSDQFYDEVQFESYRRLGLHIIEEVCGAEFSKPERLDLARFLELAREYCAPKPERALEFAKPSDATPLVKEAAAR
jgi:hypothetical protein